MDGLARQKPEDTVHLLAGELHVQGSHEAWVVCGAWFANIRPGLLHTQRYLTCKGHYTSKIYLMTNSKLIHT